MNSLRFVGCEVALGLYNPSLMRIAKLPLSTVNYSEPKVCMSADRIVLQSDPDPYRECLVGSHNEIASPETLDVGHDRELE